jgi:prepilin-type N-terminal cleavage/methylation domain-containing protein
MQHLEKKYIFLKNKGFTLLETIFAIVIFSLALVSLMAVASRGITTINSAREEMIASYLNQEAVEIIRWWRDNEKLTTPPGTPILMPGQVLGNMSGGPLAFCGPLQPTPVVCSISTVPSIYIYPQFATCLGSCPPLYENNGSYHTNPIFGGTRTPFTREVYLTLDPTGGMGGMGQLDIKSVVRWESRGVKRSVSLHTSIKDW